MGKVKMNTIIIDEKLEGTSTNIYPWKGTYFQDIEIPIEAIANPGYQFVRWDGINITDENITISIEGDTNFTAIFQIDTTYIEPLPLFINELQSANKNVTSDEYGEFDDWLELYNPNDFPVELNQYALTDNRDYPNKYKIDIPLSIPAKGFAHFWCDDHTGQGINHTNFKLSQKPNEFLGLYNIKLDYFEDSIVCPNIPQNKSYGRSFDGSSEWIVFNTPTPNATNKWIDEEVTDLDEIFLYPNPNSTSVLFASQEITGKIFSITGTYVGNVLHSKTIPIQGLSSGVYLIKIENNEVLKFVVIKT
jgi:hypothetical protein